MDSFWSYAQIFSGGAVVDQDNVEARVFQDVGAVGAEYAQVVVLAEVLHPVLRLDDARVLVDRLVARVDGDDITSSPPGRRMRWSYESAHR